MSHDLIAQRKLIWIPLIGIVLSAIAVAFLWPRKRPPPPPQKPAAAKPAPKHFKPPATLAELMKLSTADLDHFLRFQFYFSCCALR